MTDRRTDGRTDGRTDRRTGKNNMSPDPSGGGGGRHNSQEVPEQDLRRTADCGQSSAPVNLAPLCLCLSPIFCKPRAHGWYFALGI